MNLKAELDAIGGTWINRSPIAEEVTAHGLVHPKTMGDGQYGLWMAIGSGHPIGVWIVALRVDKRGVVRTHEGYGLSEYPWAGMQWRPVSQTGMPVPLHVLGPAEGGR